MASISNPHDGLREPHERIHAPLDFPRERRHLWVFHHEASAQNADTPLGDKKIDHLLRHGIERDGG